MRCQKAAALGVLCRSSLIVCVVLQSALLHGQSAKISEPDALHKADAAFHAGYADMQAAKYEEARAEFARMVSLRRRSPRAMRHWARRCWR
jgi:hypothetical protein